MDQERGEEVTTRGREKPKPTAETQVVIDLLLPWLSLPDDCEERQLKAKAKAFFSVCFSSMFAPTRWKEVPQAESSEFVKLSLKDNHAGAFLRECLINAKDLMRVATMRDTKIARTKGGIVSKWIEEGLSKAHPRVWWFCVGKTYVLPEVVPPSFNQARTSAEWGFDLFWFWLVDILSKSFTSQGETPNGAYFVGVCVACGCGFQKDRSDMIYCSKKCQRLALVHRFRAKCNAFAKGGKKK